MEGTPTQEVMLVVMLVVEGRTVLEEVIFWTQTKIFFFQPKPEFVCKVTMGRRIGTLTTEGFEKFALAKKCCFSS